MPRTVRGQIFETTFDDGTIGEYNATTGATINASLVSGLNGPQFIDVEAVPEPTTVALLTAGTLLCSIWRRQAA